MNIPTLTAAQEKDIIHSILNVTSRNVTIVTVSGRAPCVVCSGNNPFCPTCFGNGTVDTELSYTVPAKVKWTASDDKIYTKLGQFPAGDCVLTFPANPSGAIIHSGDVVILEKVQTIFVDNRTCVVDKWYFRGDPVNRVYVVLREDIDGEQRIG